MKSKLGTFQQYDITGDTPFAAIRKFTSDSGASINLIGGITPGDDEGARVFKGAPRKIPIANGLRAAEDKIDI